MLTPNPPLLMLSKVLWDRPQFRAGVVSAWHKFHGDHKNSAPARAWAAVRGPVGAAYAHLLEVGAEWTAPFTIIIFDHPVDFLGTPPLQLQELLLEHARLHLDYNLLEHLCVEYSWPAADVMQVYKGGVDWPLIRRALNGKVGELGALERHALELLVCNGFWSDERRWKAGYQGHSSCRACAWEAGGIQHIIHAQCSAMEWHTSQRRALGLSIQLPEAALSEGYQPLACMGLPPRSRKWEPVPAEPHEGHISMAAGRDLFGDGSGLNQSSREGALATWAVTRLERDGPVEAPRDVKLVEAARGRVAGWFQTVPRAELSAMEFALRHMAIDGRYIGDCAFALEGAALGVPLHLRAAGSFNADLWRLIHRRIEDIGPQVGFKKTKAHRSMAAAEVDPHDGVWYWHGNQHADAQCKDLVKTIERQDGGAEQADMMEATAVAVFRLVSSSVTWAFRNLGDFEPQRKKSK